GELGFARPMQPRSRMSDLWSLTPSSAAAPAQETKSSVQGSQSRNGDAELSVTAKYSIGFGHIMLFRLAKTIIAFTLSFCLALTATSLAARHKSTSIKRLDMASVNGTEWQENARSSPPLIIKLQVLLDRAHVSPGEIDGNLGENTRKAIEVFRELKGLGRK